MPATKAGFIITSQAVNSPQMSNITGRTLDFNQALNSKNLVAGAEISALALESKILTSLAKLAGLHAAARDGNILTPKDCAAAEKYINQAL